MRASITSLAKPVREKTEPTNLRLPIGLKQEAARVAVSRYNCTLTALTAMLLRGEIRSKKGLIPVASR